MKIFTSLQQYTKPQKSLVTVLGNFDGVHLGHQHLIKMAKKIAESNAGESLVFTFYPHPQFLFNEDIKMLNSFERKLELIQGLGVENVLIIPFTREIAQLTPSQFVDEVLCKKIQTSHVVAGFNYSFGYLGEGKADDLIKLARQQNINATIMNAFYVKNELVSSTKIREYIKIGTISNATQLLGYQPTLIGKVIEGNKFGRQMGFPTANLEWDRRLLIPANGVYAVKVRIDNKKYLGVLNVGSKPTVSEKPILTMEVNILEFNRDIYEEYIQIEFYEKLRDEIKYPSVKQLQNQISSDVKNAIAYFKKTFDAS